MKYFVSILVLLVTVGATAQTAAPSLNAEQLAKIDAFESRIEASQLQISNAQMRLEKTVREAQTYLQSLKKDGYTLQRTDKGWEYVVEEKK